MTVRSASAMRYDGEAGFGLDLFACPEFLVEEVRCVHPLSTDTYVADIATMFQ